MVTTLSLVAAAYAVLQLVIATAIAYVAGLLLRPKVPKGPANPFERDLVPPSQRGSYAPFVLGRNLVTPVIAGVKQAGLDILKAEGGGKGGGGGGGGEAGRIYYDKGVHVLNAGLPMVGLYRILAGDRVVWSGSVTSASGDGVEVTTAADGTFRVYWGGLSGSADAVATELTGVASGYPYMARIVWDTCRLENRTNWENFEYEIETAWPSAPLTINSQHVGTGAARGLNYGHCLFGLITAAPPLGRGLDADEWLWESTFEAMAQATAAEGLGVNAKFAGGTLVSDVIDTLLDEIGYTLTEHLGKLAVLPTRPADSTGTIPAKTIIDRFPEDRYSLLSDPGRPVSYVWEDRELNFRQNTLIIPHDNTADPAGVGDPEQRPLNTVTDATMAQTIASRDALRFQANPSSIEVRVNRDAARFSVGQKATLDGFGTMRISGRTREPDAGASLILIRDPFSAAAVAASPIVAITPPTALTEAPADLRIAVVQDGTSHVRLFRLRGSPSVSGASVWLGLDTADPRERGEQPAYAGGGDLTSALPAEDEWAPSTGYVDDDLVVPTSANYTGFRYRCISSANSGSTEPTWPTAVGQTVSDAGVTWQCELTEDGPTFTVLNDDKPWTDLVDDDNPDFLNGYQVALIGAEPDWELVYVREVAAVAETAWAATTLYSTGAFRRPLTGSTGLRYEATTGGTSGGTEPAWPTVVGQTVNDGSVVWTARRLAYQLKGLIRGRQGSAERSHVIGDDVYVIRSDSLGRFTAPGLTAGVDVLAKTLPFVGSVPGDLADSPTSEATMV